MKRKSVQIHYPFHPLYGQQLQLFLPSRSAAAAMTVEDSNQKRLKIPSWMVTPDAEQFHLAETSGVDAQALLRLVELFDLHCGKLLEVEGDPETEASHEAALVDQASTRE